MAFPTKWIFLSYVYTETVSVDISDTSSYAASATSSTSFAAADSLWPNPCPWVAPAPDEKIYLVAITITR